MPEARHDVLWCLFHFSFLKINCFIGLNLVLSAEGCMNYWLCRRLFLFHTDSPADSMNILHHHRSCTYRGSSWSGPIQYGTLQWSNCFVCRFRIALSIHLEHKATTIIVLYNVKPTPRVGTEERRWYDTTLINVQASITAAAAVPLL